MNGYVQSSYEIVNAEDNSMGGVVEGGAGSADGSSPRKATIQKVQAELRQKYNARDATKRELEFLEKGGDLLDFKLPYGASVSVQSTSVTHHHQNDRLLANEAKGSFALASSHGDSVESTGGPRLAPFEANSADNLLLIDAETEFSEGGRSSSRPCSSDLVPVEQSAHANQTQKHGGSTASALPRKAYKRRYRSRPSRDVARSSSVDVGPAHGASLSSRQGSRDVEGLVESEAENQNKKPVVLSKSVGAVEGTSVRNEAPGEQLHCNDLDASKSIDSVKGKAEGMSRPAELDSNVSARLMNKQLNQELPSSAPRTSNELEGIKATENTIASVADNQIGSKCRKSESVDNLMPAHEINSSKCRQDEEKRSAVESSSQGIEVLKSQIISSAAGRNIDKNSISETCKNMQNAGSTTSNKNPNLLDGPSGLDISKSLLKKEAAEVSEIGILNREADYSSQHLRENGLLQSGEGLVESGCDSKNRLLDQVNAEKRHTCGSEFPGTHNGINLHQRIDSTYASNVDEESILKEAQIIEAKRRRIADLSVVISPAETQQRSHWGYVLEEMAWLSNDFSQERMWKTAAAAQISFQAIVACKSRRDRKISGKDAEMVAKTLAKAVLDFWDSVGETKEIQQNENTRNKPIREYAARIVMAHKPNTFTSATRLQLSPDRTSDEGLPDLSRDNFTYDKIFYDVPFGAMETYRKLIMSHVAHIERVGSYVPEEAELSACDDFESQDNPYDEDEGDGTFDMPVAFERSHSRGYGRKKLKHLKRRHDTWSYEVGSDVLPMQSSEMKVVNQQSGIPPKRPGNSLNVSIPTKRVRTAFRRISSPFSAGPAGSFQFPTKTDASSGDTSSLQDDQSTLRGGLGYPNAMEFESARDFERQSPFESAEVSMMSKKKKTKNTNAAYDHRWQTDYSFHEPRDHFKRRSENCLAESNGNSGLFGQPPLKKPKVLRQSRDNPYDGHLHDGGSGPSPVTSQFSNMHNQNKFVKMAGSRDRGRSIKGLKIPAGQPGSGIPWSVFEDQALVVLVHDLGPNWELISDAFNSTLQFKCVFRNAKECKERHYVLMDRTSADGADSTEDSGSSQPYPSTLPGIPKGSARQLFQRLQGPVDEDTLKSHFGTIIMIGQKLLHHRNQEPKQLQQPHSSHSIALAQVCPNKLNGGPFLTPLDLCDVAQGTDTVPTGLHGVAGSNPGMTNSLPPHGSGASSSLQGSPNMNAGNGFSSSPGPVNSSVRHAAPRCGPLSADEQQKLHHYNTQMMPGRNVAQVGHSANRSFPVARPGFQGTTASATPLVNSGSMVSPAASPNMHSGVSSAHGSPMQSRSRDALQSIRPELHMPGTGGQGGVSHFGGMSSPTVSSSSYVLHHQPPLPISPQQRPHFQGAASGQQQSYALRLAKERQQLQQRLMMQQQQSQSQPQQQQKQHQAPGAAAAADHSAKQPSRQQQQQFVQSGRPRPPQLPPQQQQVKIAANPVSNGGVPLSQPLDSLRPSSSSCSRPPFSQPKNHSGKQIQTAPAAQPDAAAALPPPPPGGGLRNASESLSDGGSISNKLPPSQVSVQMRKPPPPPPPAAAAASQTEKPTGNNSNEKPSDTRPE